MWLFSAREFREIARSRASKLVIVPTAKEASHDRFQRFRMKSFEVMAEKITGSWKP
jgi:hypothetical protein